jgi:hypothetical protein
MMFAIATCPAQAVHCIIHDEALCRRTLRGLIMIDDLSAVSKIKVDKGGWQERRG